MQTGGGCSPPPVAFLERSVLYAGLRLTALAPRASGWMSKETRWPSARLCMPACCTALTWTKTSLPPPSGAMNPNPLLVLKNFTVPMVITLSLHHRVATPAADAVMKEGCSGFLVQARTEGGSGFKQQVRFF